MHEPRHFFYLARTLPSYRIGVLQQLDRRLGGRLVVCHGLPEQSSSLHHVRSEIGDDLRVIPLPNKWVSGETLHYQNFLPIFRSGVRPAAIIAEESPRSLSLPFLIAAAKLKRVPIGLWGHFSSNYRPFAAENPSDLYRLLLARSSDACVCYTEGIADLLRPHVSSHKLFVATNTLDTDALFAYRTALLKEGTSRVRQRLSLPTDMPLLAFIGRLIKEKGTDLLLEILRGLQNGRDVGLIVIGDGPERSAMEQSVAEMDLKHVYFTGALSSFDDSSPYLFAADVMVLPGYVGLAVNHGFALGLPVVTHTSPGKMRYHSPEIEYVVDGWNGRVVGHGNVEAFIEAIREILDSRMQYAERSFEYARTQLAVDRMIDGLASAYEFLERS